MKRAHYQNLVIGFGKGGKTLAAYLAKEGQDVALIEKSEKMYGGTCINIACIPTKSLITNAEKNIPYSDAIEIKDDLTTFLRQKNYENLDKLPSATILTGTANFISEREVRVVLNDAGHELLVTADRIFINTGTVPFIPDIEGVKTSRHVYTSTSLMEQSRLPEELIIVGGGFIGLEFADMYAMFGSKVTLLDSSETFLSREDRDIAEEIFKVMTARNIRIINSASVQRVRDSPTGVTVEYKDNKSISRQISGSAVLIATGRRPNLDGLNVNVAGIKLNAKGYIEVDEQLKTNINNIWALGDINGGPQFTYISLDDFRIVRDQIFPGEYNSRTKRKQVASTVFITPPLAHIGLRETEAKERGYNLKIATLRATSIPRARILNNTQGILKSVIDADTNKILGCTLFCADAGEMINTIQVAMNAGVDFPVIRDTIFTHPSMNEAFNDLYASI